MSNLNPNQSIANGPNPEYKKLVVSNTSFGEALMWAKDRNKRIMRLAWNGKNMWVCVGAGAKIEAKEFWNIHTYNFALTQPGGQAEVLPYMIMKTADDKILMGWLASQSDMLANDWCVLED